MRHTCGRGGCSELTGLQKSLQSSKLAVDDRARVRFPAVSGRLHRSHARIRHTHRQGLWVTSGSRPVLRVSRHVHNWRGRLLEIDDLNLYAHLLRLHFASAFGPAHRWHGRGCRPGVPHELWIPVHANGTKKRGSAKVCCGRIQGHRSCHSLCVRPFRHPKGPHRNRLSLRNNLAEPQLTRLEQK